MSRKPYPSLGLRVGDLVEVRSREEILATLDDQGAYGGMPFMPEMLEFCGRRFRVSKRADKTCNTITAMESRRLYDTVHLDDLRCSGSAHGGCQAQCFLFWKEAWLKRVHESKHLSESTSALAGSPATLRCDESRLRELAQNSGTENQQEIHYRCQATELVRASEPLRWWDLRQYVRDVWSGNVTCSELLKVMLFRLFLRSLKVGIAYRAQIWAYDRLQGCRGGTPYPFRQGQLEKTPRETLNLRAGELVQVKSYEEILKTLSKNNKNRGLLFGEEMVPYCGKQYRVRARVEQIIDEHNGRMMKLPGECITLEGVVCRAEYSEGRLFCPRNILPYWREIWLKRVASPDS